MAILSEDTETITSNILKFRQTKNPWFLSRALYCTMKQGRAPEALYCTYHRLFEAPSPICCEQLDTHIISHISKAYQPFDFDRLYCERDTILRAFLNDFHVAPLPGDFEAARYENIYRGADYLVIGEYAEQSARIAFITKNHFSLIHHYNSIPGVRHIHAVKRIRNTNYFFVSTGDVSKRLDLWKINGDSLCFVRPIKKHLAGYTAIAYVNGEHFFGTDFSSRPNYITQLNGRKYFFPEKAYDKFVQAFFSYDNRYIFSINSEMEYFGEETVLSVFDAVTKTFVYCDYIQKKTAFAPSTFAEIDTKFGLQLRENAGMQNVRSLV